MNGAARRLSGWAANLLATGLILVAGLALGRQVLEWWKEDRTTADAKGKSAGAQGGDLGDSDLAHQVELGNLPFALRRAAFTGDKTAVFAALREQGLRVVPEPVDPTGKAGPAERRMLSHIAEQKPVAQSAGRWELYELDGPLLLVAGIQFFAAENRAGAERRVVFWGLALPQGADYSGDETTWTLFTYHPANGVSEDSPAIVRLTVPSDLHETLSLATDDGSQLIAFRAPGDGVALSRNLEQALANQAWKQAGPWRQESDVWHGRFEKSRAVAVVSWKSESGGELTGVIMIQPASEDTP